jgi:hypothetical protein
MVSSGSINVLIERSNIVMQTINTYAKELNEYITFLTTIIRRNNNYSLEIIFRHGLVKYIYDKSIH